MHPAIWFAGIWIASISSSVICCSLGVSSYEYPDLAEDLTWMVSVTTVCFAVTVVVGYALQSRGVSVKPPKMEIRFAHYERILPVLAIAGLLGGIYFCMHSGSGLHLGQNRIAYLEMQDEGITNSLGYKLGYKLYNCNFPIAVYVGILYTQRLRRGMRFASLFSWIAVCPLLASILYAASTGGRREIMTIIFMYVFGVSLQLACYGRHMFPRSALVKTIVWIFVAAIAFSLFAGVVASERREAVGKTRDVWETYPVLRPFGPMLYYLAEPYQGYPYKLIYLEDEEVTTGAYTFKGITDIGIPLVHRVTGFQWNLSTLLGIKGRDLVESRSWLGMDQRLVAALGSIYSGLYLDFGKHGRYIAVLLLVVLSEVLFQIWLRMNKSWVICLVPIVVILYFWSNSIFRSVLGGPFPGVLLRGAIVADVGGMLAAKCGFAMAIPVFAYRKGYVTVLSNNRRWNRFSNRFSRHKQSTVHG